MAGKKGSHLSKRCGCKDEAGKQLGAKCPKLRRKDGSWHPEHGTWSFQLEMPRGEGGSRRPPLRRGGFATSAEAQAAYDAAVLLQAGGADPSVRLRTGAYMTSWLAGRRDLKRTTRRGYEQIIRIYLVPLLGHVPLQELSRENVSGMFRAIDQWNTDLAEGSRRSPYQKHCGPEMMQRIRACLRAALNDAIPEKKVAYNAAALIKMPGDGKSGRKRKQVEWIPARAEAFWAGHAAWVAEHPGIPPFSAWKRKELRPAKVMVWSSAQTGRFLDAMAGDRLAAMFELVADTGMRRGELAGLSWDNTDFDSAAVTVWDTRVALGWEVIDETPKSEAGGRTLPVTSRTVKALRALKTAQAAEKLAFGEAYQNTGLVFVREDGSAMHPQEITAYFQRRAFALGLPCVTLHGMRHGTATQLLKAGVDTRVVADRLGHSTTTLTRDTYQVVLDEVAREAADKGAAAIPRQDGAELADHIRITSPPPGRTRRRGA